MTAVKLCDIFDESIKSADLLVKYYEALSARQSKKPKSNWINKLYEAKVIRWPRKDGFWRANSKAENILLIGNNNGAIKEHDFHFENISVLLRTALVMAMAAVDKILHEAISYNFSALLSSGELNKLANIPLSESYQIAIKSRERIGKGGNIKIRPGHMFKEIVLQELYRKTFLANQQLETICKSCGKNGVFARYKDHIRSTDKAEVLKERWGRIYNRRNSIAHECDIVRKKKAKKMNYHKVNEKQILEDIKYVKEFGMFLSIELQNGEIKKKK